VPIESFPGASASSALATRPQRVAERPRGFEPFSRGSLGDAELVVLPGGRLWIANGGMHGGFLEEALRTARSVNHAPFPRVGACQITCTGALAPPCLTIRLARLECGTNRTFVTYMQSGSVRVGLMASRLRGRLIRSPVWPGMRGSLGR